VAWFTRDVTRTLMAHGPVVVFGIAATVLTARVLGPESRGVFALVLLIGNLAAFCGKLGLGQSIVYHVARLRLPPERVLGTSLLLVAALGVLVGALLALAEPWLAHQFPNLRADAYAPIVFAAPLFVANGVLQDFFRAIDRLDLFNLCRMLSPAVRLSALAVAFAFGGGVVEAVESVLVAELVLLFVQLWLIARRGRPVFGATGDLWRSLTGLGARVAGAAAIVQVDQRLASLVIGAQSPAAELGFFSVAEGPVRNLVNLSNLIGSVLLPKIAQEGDADAAHMTAATTRITLLLMAAVCAGIALLSYPIVLVAFGREFVAAAAILAALQPLAVAQAGGRILSRYFVASNRTRGLAVSSAVSPLVQIPLLFLLTPRFGAAGAATAASLSAVASFAVLVFAFARLSGLPLRAAVVPVRADLTRIARVFRDAITLRALRPAGGAGR
jgi:O-antigen/teichoic acid export membrane protein